MILVEVISWMLLEVASSRYVVIDYDKRPNFLFPVTIYSANARYDLLKTPSTSGYFATSYYLYPLIINSQNYSVQP